MKTFEQKRIDILQERLKRRTKAGGRPLPGYEQNVAAIRAEIETLSGVAEDKDAE